MVVMVISWRHNFYGAIEDIIRTDDAVLRLHVIRAFLGVCRQRWQWAGVTRPPWWDAANYAQGSLLMRLFLGLPGTKYSNPIWPVPNTDSQANRKTHFNWQHFRFTSLRFYRIVLTAKVSALMLYSRLKNVASVIYNFSACIPRIHKLQLIRIWIFKDFHVFVTFANEADGWALNGTHE